MYCWPMLMPNVRFHDSKFELHTICGVNDQVSSHISYLPHEYHHSHLDFIATPKSTCGGGVLTIFFPKISNGMLFAEILLCQVCPLKTKLK
jgi:hypothetical protein